MPKIESMTGLHFFELSQPWGHFTPTFPGFDDTVIFRSVNHARHGVMSQRIRGVMQSSTHVNAPIHLIQGGASVGAIPIERFFGNGVVLDIPKGQWESVTAADLEVVGSAVQTGDIVVINTGWHERYADSREYFGCAPGLDPAAAQWLVDRKIRLLGWDTATVDHPLATSLGEHRNGPLIRDLARDYEACTGRSAKADFPEWNPAHRILLGAGVPTIENVGGEVSDLAGQRCTFHALPWKWMEGDSCIVRFIAITDPAGSYRIEAGNRERVSA